MSIRGKGMWLMSVVLAGTGHGTVRAELPGERPVYYYIREIPADPTSDVAYVVRLDLAAAAVDGDWIGWRIALAEFRNPETAEIAGDVWVDDAPELDSPDGLWWVEHADPAVPGPSDFLVPPYLVGPARAVDPRTADLVYDLGEAEYAALAEEAPSEIADTLMLYGQGDGEGDPTPVGKGDNLNEPGPDEPLNVPNGVNDPG